MHLEEKTKDSAIVYDGKIFKIKRDNALLEDGSTAVREFVVHYGGVCILPVNADGTVLLVKQYRYPLGKVTLEVPAGKLERGEDHFEAGKRELLEETGTTAGSFEYLGEIAPIPAYTTEIIHMYLAKGLTFSAPDPDDDEFLDVVRMPFEEALEMVLDGRITDSKTMIILMKAALMKKSAGNNTKE